MWSKDYYIATRNPSLGGLKIIETNKEFPEMLKREISDNCLELISPDYEQHPLAIYPIDDSFVVSMSFKVAGDEYESRPHEVIHGIVVQNEEFESITEIIAENEIDRTFSNEKFGFCDKDWQSLYTNKNALQLFLNNMGATRILGLYHAVRNVIENKKKVQLLVAKGKERIVQAACYSVLSPTLRKQLFTISNGECTLRDADILITKSIKYQNAEKYETMSFMEFVKEGSKLAEVAEKRQQNERVNNLIECCLKYIGDSRVPKQRLSEVRQTSNSLTSNEKRMFQCQLRSKLATLRTEKKALKRYIQILYLAFESLQEVKLKQNEPIILPPYKIESMILFLKEYCTHKKEFERCLQMMLEIMTENFTLYMPSKLVKKEIKKGLKEWRKAMVF